MARKVWFQLVDAATRGEFAGTQTASVLSDGTDDIEDLRDKIHTAYDHTKPPGRNLLAHLAPNQLKIYANREVYNEMNSQPLDEDSLIGARGASKKDALIVVVPQRQRSDAGLVDTSLTYADGINPTSIHFSREPILTRMAEWMTGEEGKNHFLLLNSPAASGKTSLLNLFQYKNPGLNARYVSFKRAMSPWEILRLHGLDVVHEHCDYENVIFMIDDAQFQYGDAVFWAAIVKDIPLMVGPGVRFIISTTHVISTQGQSSPAVFKQLETISREDLLLSLVRKRL
ncbi:hypothetical protein PF004_g5744 [Phytophthora fragariae]|uniref:Uncharacterized protein n=1 Tax=Phytophthora fragariae TaxID=53985 RepID=A0A6G0PF37_9STRA|nr:hypothetical protein PF004_g5744 [Phytophthora fragariae]